MIVDLAEFADGTTLDVDVCIVGGGAAGITLALELKETSSSLCLLEAGGLEFETQVQDAYGGEVSGVDYPPLDTVRLRYLGGTTNHWVGQSTPLDPLDFERRPWVEFSGWPIDYREFASYLGRARKVCLLRGGGFSWDAWNGRPDVPAFPFEGSDFEPVVLRHPDPVTRFGEVYRQDLARATNLTCLLHASVRRLVSNDRGTRVTAAQVMGLDGRAIDVRARLFIVATGGIENSRLLLVSGPEGGPGLGNEHDVVGRYFMGHPKFDAGEIVLEANDAAAYLSSPYRSVDGYTIRTDFKLDAARQAELEILNHTAFLLPTGVSRDKAARAAGFLARAWRGLERVLDAEDAGEETFALRVRLEQAPRPGSRVSLSRDVDTFGMPRAALHLELGELEERTLLVVQAEVARELGRSGLGRMRVDLETMERRWPSATGWQIHHCGGTRMSSTPTRGVVDRNCRIHGVENVYVAGSSVFPTGGHANPTMNLLALTLRLSDHIREKLAT